jgi:autophagy-related protein 16-1
LQLELSQVEERNQALTKDNAKLLQRWLDAKQSEVNKMNTANDFYEEMRSHKQMVVNWQDGQDSAARSGAAALADALDEDLTIQSGRAAALGNSSLQPGNGLAGEGATVAGTKDGMRSPMRKDVSLTPNG